MAFEDTLELILKKTKIPKEEVIRQIDEKYGELAGLITREGAAYIVARNLGIDLPSAVRGLQIKNVLPGMRNLNIIGRIFRISSITEFTRSNGEKGRVVNLYIADETGHVKIPLWNDQVSLVSDELVKVGDIVQLVNGMARESIFGDVEIILGKYGSIRPLEGEFNIPAAEELQKNFFGVTRRVKISEISPGRWEIRATILNVFRGKYLFSVCPICGSTTDGKVCPEHGAVEPSNEMVFNAVADDGTGDVRVVFFRKVAEKLLGTTADELAKLEEEKRFEIAQQLLGRELVLVGRAKKNVNFNRIEFLVDDFKDIDIREECKKLLQALG